MATAILTLVAVGLADTAWAGGNATRPAASVGSTPAPLTPIPAPQKPLWIPIVVGVLVLLVVFPIVIAKACGCAINTSTTPTVENTAPQLRLERRPTRVWKSPPQRKSIVFNPVVAFGSIPPDAISISTGKEEPLLFNVDPDDI